MKKSEPLVEIRAEPATIRLQATPDKSDLRSAGPQTWEDTLTGAAYLQ
jgi:hypothetical protein